MDAGGNAHAAAGIQRWEAGIATCAHDHIGLKFFDDLLAGTYGGQHIFCRLDILLDAAKIQFPGQAGAGQALDLISGLGHQLFFHAALGADKKNVDVGMTLLHHIGNGDGGVDMAAGTAAGEDHIHRGTSCSFG